MALGVEQNGFIGTPAPVGIDRPPQDYRFQFRYLAGDRVEVRHPFHGTTTLGDGSYFTDSGMDAAAVVLFKEMPYLVDSMKLSRPRRFETRPYAGEFSQLSHCFSLGMLAVAFAGNPLDILNALYNDAPQTYNGHQGDDNYQGHGHEDLHDYDRPQFFEGAGITDALIEAGALTRTASGIYIGRSQLSIDRLLSEEEADLLPTFLSNKNLKRRADADRIQYSEEERFYNNLASRAGMSEPARVALSLANFSMASITRRFIREDGEGDQLLFTDERAAMLSTEDYSRHNSEHWTEPVQDLVSDMLNFAERYFFLCDHPLAKSYQYFYPRDYLHTSASKMYELFFEVAKDDQVMAWVLSAAERIARDQSQKSMGYLQGASSYKGPAPPDGVMIEKIEPTDLSEDGLTKVVHNQFVITLPPGKMRTLNPRVTNGDKKTEVLGDIAPEFYKECRARQQWIGYYQARVDIENSALATKLGKAVSMVQSEWKQQLMVRPFMPPSELQLTIREANEYVLRHGRVKAA